jgi:hypothetical protein
VATSNETVMRIGINTLFLIPCKMGGIALIISTCVSGRSERTGFGTIEDISRKEATNDQQRPGQGRNVFMKTNGWQDIGLHEKRALSVD